MKKKQEKVLKEKTVKLNDKVDKKRKPEKYISEEAREVRNFAFILIGIIVIVLAVYGVSKVLVKDKTVIDTEGEVEGTINYDVVNVGTMFNRNYSEYYVMLYDKDDSKAIVYSAIINKYMSKEKAEKIYFCNIGNELNKKYVAEDGKGNKKAKTIDDLSVGKLTLVKIKNGKIVKYLEDVDTIKKELGV